MQDKNRSKNIKVGGTLAVVAIVTLLSLVASSKKDVNEMLENSASLEISAKEYYDENGSWPTNNRAFSFPDTLFSEENVLSNMDEDELVKAGYIEKMESKYVDFGIVTDGPEEGKVFFVGNEGEGVYEVGGKVFYGDDLVVKERFVFQPLIPVPVFVNR